MKYDQLVNKYKKKGYRLSSYGKINELGRIFCLYKFTTGAVLSKKIMLITTGFHGEEFNGPVSLVRIIDQIARHARKKGVKVIVYPCINPSGFELHKRYNASDEFPNNDFLRYTLSNNNEVGYLRKNEFFKKLKIVKSKAKEVKILQTDIKKSILSRKFPNAVVDIHQDDTLGKFDYYLYLFEKNEYHKNLMNEVDKFAVRARCVRAVDKDIDGRKINYSIDKDGVIMLHDGTLTDLFYRKGVKDSITVETNVFSPLATVCKINSYILKKIIDKIA